MSTEKHNGSSPWWRHDANLTTDLRFSKLRSLLKADPYGLLCRLYDFAASNRQDGDVAQIDATVFADRLEFKGSGARLRKILTQAGYLDQQGVIVEWHDRLFRLYSSIREQNSERGKKSAAQRAQAKAKAEPSPTGENTTQENRRGENITATVERPVERPVETIAQYSPLSVWPKSLSPEQIAGLAKDTGKAADFIAAKWPAYRDRKIAFADPNDDLAGFRHELRTAKQASQKKEDVIEPEPEGWQARFPDFVDRDKPWAQLQPIQRAWILENMN